MNHILGFVKGKWLPLSYYKQNKTKQNKTKQKQKQNEQTNKKKPFNLIAILSTLESISLDEIIRNA